MLVVSLLALTASAAQPREARVAELLEAYERSHSRCTHGADGVIITLHTDTTPVAFKRHLEASAEPRHRETNRFGGAFRVLNMLSMTAIHPETLRWVSRHEHAVRIQASCVRVRGLPKPEDPSGQAGIFEGRYLGGSSLQPTCGRYIKVANPWSASSAATVKVNTTGLAPVHALFSPFALRSPFPRQGTRPHPLVSAVPTGHPQPSARRCAAAEVRAASPSPSHRGAWCMVHGAWCRRASGIPV